MFYYAVAVGRTRGVYRSWTECEAQVKKFPYAKHKRFDNLAEAESFCEMFGPGVPVNAGAIDAVDASVDVATQTMDVGLWFVCSCSRRRRWTD